jgi:serine/threonine protein phosphatase PrpC
MGTYLSTPVLDKDTEEGEDLDCAVPVAWGVVDMQGWRRTMEDAHVAQTNIPPPPFANTTSPVKIFAVFDGHGGAEVARFCQLYLIDVLTRESYWNSESLEVGKALAGAFHALDRLIDCPNRR